MIKFSEISEQVSEMKLKVIEQLVSMIEQTEDNEIILNINNILLIRKYLDNFLMYIYKGIDEKTF
jgi:hypothetical protein